MFDKFREKGGEMVEERINKNENTEESPESQEFMESIKSMESAESTSAVESVSKIGIENLIIKRVKFEAAIGYVGLMIKSLKDKRTLLEKDKNYRKLMNT